MGYPWVLRGVSWGALGSSKEHSGYPRGVLGVLLGVPGPHLGVLSDPVVRAKRYACAGFSHLCIGKVNFQEGS